MRPRINTEILGERVASLETSSVAHESKIKNHEDRLDGHDAWFNQVRGSLRTLVVLWTIAVGILGILGVRFIQDLVARPVSASSAKP